LGKLPGILLEEIEIFYPDLRHIAFKPG